MSVVFRARLNEDKRGAKDREEVIWEDANCREEGIEYDWKKEKGE